MTWSGEGSGDGSGWAGEEEWEGTHWCCGVPVSTTCPQIIQKGLVSPPAALWLLIFLNKKLRGFLYLCPSEDTLIHHSQSNKGLLIACLCVGR